MPALPGPSLRAALGDDPSMPPDDPAGSSPPPVTATLPGRTAGNGHGALGEVAPRRVGPLPGPSTKPALVVLGIIAALFVAGFLVDVLTGGAGKPAATPHSLATARGSPLHAVPARPLLRGMVSQGEPPSDIVDALAAPAGSAAVPSSTTSRGVESYDRSIRLQDRASQQDVIAFFTAQMPAMHWKRLSAGAAAGGGFQLLFQHPGSDGHEWELGVTVSATGFPATGTAASAAPSTTSAPGAGRGTTPFTLRLFVQSDQA